MRHEEENNLSDFYEKYNWDNESEGIKRRGAIKCRIWSVGESDCPIAVHFKCKFCGLGKYSNALFRNFLIMKVLGTVRKVNFINIPTMLYENTLQT